MKIFSDIIANCILAATTFYVASTMLNKKINFRNFKVYFLYLLTVFFPIFNYYFVSGYFRLVSVTVFFAIIIRLLFKATLIESVITSIFYEVVIVISECVFTLILNLIFGLNAIQIVNSQAGGFLSNIIIAVFCILIIKIKSVKKIYNKINSFVDRLNEKYIILMCLFTIVCVNVCEAAFYYNLNFADLLTFNALLMGSCFLIVLYSFKTKNNYNKVYDKYNTTLNSLKEYEDILDKYKISNHENKNELLTIRNMIPKNHKKTISYIDKIIDNKLKDNDKVMFEVSRIPSGGLRGLIYSKILLMQEIKICYTLDISKEIRTVDFIKMDDNLVLDVCKVIGVYLDNSIDAVTCLNEKNIVIQMYIEENKLVISISNNFEGILDVEKLENRGYSSKGKKHGYGLTLSKQIINNNKNLTNEKKIDKNIFSQVLKIKI